MKTKKQEVVWNKGEITTIGARTAGGKTQTAVHEALKSAEKGKNVLYLAMVNKKEDILSRLVSYKLGRRIDFYNIKKEDETEYKDTIKEIEDLPIEIEEHTTLTIEEMVEIIEDKEDVDLLIVDPVDYIDMPFDRQSLIEEVEKLAHLSTSKNLGILLTLQIGREDEASIPFRKVLITLLSNRYLVIGATDESQS